MWQQLLIKFLLEAGIEAGPSFGKMAGVALSEFFDDVRQAIYTPDLIEYAYLIAAGVIVNNPTMNLQFQYELVEEGIRLLTTNPKVKKPPTPLSVKALTVMSLLRAGFKGETE